MVTLAQAGRHASDRHAAPATGDSRASVLRMGVPGRLLMAGGAMVLLWSAIALGLA